MRFLKPLIFAVTIAVIFILNSTFGWSAKLSEGGLSYIASLVEENIGLAAVIYLLMTVIGCVVLALPGVTFAVFAGALFNPWLGTLLCLAAATIGAVMAFLVGRFFLRDAVKPMIAKNKLLNRLFFEDSGKSDVVLLILTLHTGKPVGFLRRLP